MFDTRFFLRDNFQVPSSLRAFLVAYGVDAPSLETVTKWFQRSAIPGDWFPVLLAFIELETGSPVSMTKYLK